MLRKIRISFATLFFIGITLLFVGIGQQWWGWMACLQFLPSCLALNFAVIAGIIILTLLFGRIYCSVICPMGVFQDIVNAISAGRKGKKQRFHFHKENRALRDFFLALTLLALMFGVQWFVVLIAPYSAYGRMVRTIVDPSSPTAIIVGVSTFVVISVFAWIWGREWCNSICPVGTVLSLFSRFSLFRPAIDTDKCVHCGACEKRCKASCISSFDQKIDYSRCVDCFDCLENCKVGAIRYKFAYGRKGGNETKKEEGVDTGKRAFVATAAFLGGSAIAKADGGLAKVIDKQNPQRSERLVPFGAGSVKDFYDRCTACGLCISACPNKVLRPSTDLQHLMQPQMGYEKGYCRPECTACSQICPTDAILPISKEQKTVIHIGHAKVNHSLCLSCRDGIDCGNCARHCPVGAIRMVESDGRKIPVVNEELCIGCGACENLCPSRPISAIVVNGLSVHQFNQEV